MRILLLAGGWSTEREISLSGARAMAKAMESLGHTVTLFDLKDFDALLVSPRSMTALLSISTVSPGRMVLCRPCWIP